WEGENGDRRADGGVVNGRDASARRDDPSAREVSTARRAARRRTAITGAFERSGGGRVDGFSVGASSQVGAGRRRSLSRHRFGGDHIPVESGAPRLRDLRVTGGTVSDFFRTAMQDVVR